MVSCGAGLNSSNCRPRPRPAWLISTSNASICDLFGSCFSSAPKELSISRSCWRYRSRLTADCFLPLYSSLSFASCSAPAASSSTCPCQSATYPATTKATRVAIKASSLGRAGQVPGSFGLRYLNCSSSLFIRPFLLFRACRSSAARPSIARSALGGAGLGLLAPDADVHGEFGQALVVDSGRLDLDQVRVLQIGRSLQVAHQGRYPRVGLRIAAQ